VNKIVNFFKTMTNASQAAASPESFRDLGLIEPILKAIKDAGYETPTPIQAAAIPYVLHGRDLLGCAQTGTGKTAAFALPVLQRLALGEGRKRGVRALILTPTRELAAQIDESFRDYGRHLHLNRTLVFGGVGLEPQKRSLAHRPDIVVATPGRLLDLAAQGAVSFDQLEIFVLDEADRMLDMGFIHDVKRVIALLPKVRQNLLFSATMPPEIQDLIDKILRDPAKVAVTPTSSTNELIDQSVYYVDRPNKRHLLMHVLQSPDVRRALVFTRTKAIANRVAAFITDAGMSAEAIHGNKSQNARLRALSNFKSGSTKILVASDLAARGIDINEVSHVINYDVPNVAETYVHRIGRTGRAANSGVALSFCDADEKPYILGIEKLIKKRIPVVNDHPYPMTNHTPSPANPGARQRSRPQRHQQARPAQRDHQNNRGQRSEPQRGTKPQGNNNKFRRQPAP
jgi:ATP-dependent RNA helicase RhlE